MNDFNFNQPFVVVGGLLEKDGKYLLVKESGGPEKGKWNLPAGIWDAGETLVEGAKREVKEETGFEFEPKRLLGSYIRNRNGNSVLIHIYRGDFAETDSEKEDDVEETRWFSEEEIKEMNSDTLRFVGLPMLIEQYKNNEDFPVSVTKVLSSE